MYQLRPPHPDLFPFVEHYWFVTSEDGPVDLRVDVYVDARADLIFNFGAPYEREVIGGATVQHTASNLDAQRLVPIRIHQRGMVRIAGVRFRLGGLGPFTRSPLKAFTNQTPRPAVLFGREAEALERALEADRTVDAQAQRLDAFLRACRVVDDEHHRLSAALARLAASDGESVDDVAHGVGVSSRQLDRIFARRLGIPPKTVGRVLRFQRALRGLMQDPGCSLAELAASVGYFDQAHFVKDFRRMTGGVPRGYRGYYPPEAPPHFAPNVVAFLQDGSARPAQGRAPGGKTWPNTGPAKARKTIPGS